VEARLVDSFFGNISYRLGQTVFISQTASSLDELGGCIDACPLDGSSCVGLTASSEYSAHADILTRTENRSILHGHPKFSVILSMLCDDPDCPGRGRCHLECPKARSVKDIPIIPGEVGTGRFGLSRTLPPAIKGRRGAIVYGHGLFTVGRVDFRDAFANLIDIERTCLEEYLART
jgi:ribulose-5-phosphate 4-epimerase/fuculose-1-phosphate aldolase